VAQVWLRRGEWHGLYLLDEEIVRGITPFLTQLGLTEDKPYTLVANLGKSFQGSNVLGMGFTMEPEEAQALIKKDPRNRDVLYPFLNGEDLNSRPDQSPSRWVINFHDWPLERAETYPDCIKIVREKVKPVRDLNIVKSRRELWWQFTRPVLVLYATISEMKRVLTIALTSRTCAFTFTSSNLVFSHATLVFAFDAACYFAVLQSSFHVEWAFFYGSSMKGDLRYTPTDCFENFPFPINMQSLDNIGEHFYDHRQSIMLMRWEGLTKTYNRFHDPQEVAEDIVKLRELHKEIDVAVARAYGWNDLEMGHGFHETKQGLRYTISEEARREVLGRLLKLNHERYAEEEALGLHEKGVKQKRKSKKNGKVNGTDKSIGLIGYQEELAFE
jgi:hypothetical protein